ncbi:Histidine kinase protein, partial [Dioscorea alata]
SARPRILLVDDAEINRVVVRRMAMELKIGLEEAENGKVAVDLLRSGKCYDLILMDKDMPVMDGHEATRQLRSMGVRSPIVALSGNGLPSDRDLFFQAGADEFQVKPLSKAQLVGLLARFGVLERDCS